MPRSSRPDQSGLRAWLRPTLAAAMLGLTVAAWPGSSAFGQEADPPSRVASVTDLDGSLSFAPAGTDDWAAAGINRPVTTGDRLWVQPGSRAELHAGSTAIRLGGGTAATVLNLDDAATQVKLTQGTLQLRLRALPPDQPVEIDTPNLAFVPREPGDYRLDVAPDGSTTVVTMRHGRATLYGDSRSVEVERGDRLAFAGTDLSDAGQVQMPPQDEFDRWAIARDVQEDNSPSAQYVPREMTGYAALDNYGEWQEDPGYGPVWFPTVVDAGWSPYSSGNWAWVAPWGWTWVDTAPWGFAPFHYGRWAHIGTRWAWVPGPRVPRPCYAPALVAFVGGGSVRVGNAPGVAWYPLAPHEAYRPVYRASPGYLGRVNMIVNNRAMDNHGRPVWNRDVPGAIRGMPSRAFVEGHSVPRGGDRFDAWRNLPRGEGQGAPQLAPVRASLYGGVPGRPMPPQARPGFERQAIATRSPARPLPDDLARRFAGQQGAPVPGAGPVWRGQPERNPRVEGGQRPEVRMSQAAPGQHGGRPGAGPDNAQPMRGFTTRPDQPRGVPPEMQRQQGDQQRAFQDQQRIQQDQNRQQFDRQQFDRQRGDQQRALQDQQRQQGDQQRAFQEQQRVQQEQNRQQFDRQRGEQQQRALQDQQRQQADQQRAFQEQQRAQQEQNRQQSERQRGEQQQRALQDQQRQQADQQRAFQDQQRAQQEQNRQQFERQRADQQQRAMQDQQRQMQDQQRQQAEQQRQMQERQRQQVEQQRQQMDQQRQQQMQERQRQQAEQQRQQMDQQRQQQMQMQRQQAEQQRQQFEQQRQQQAQMQRQAQEQQRQGQEQQRQAQEQQRQQFEQQRQQQMQQQQQRQQQQQQQRQREQQAHNGDNPGQGR